MSLREARQLLGVGPLASEAEIRRAFREAAKLAHPDRAGGSADRFRAVTEAYQRLRLGGPAADGIVQPPAPAARPHPPLEIDIAVALNGGEAVHRLGDGRLVRLTLPAGLRTGDTVRAGGEALKVAVRAEAGTMVRGDDVWLTVGVPARTLAEGGRVSIETPLGRRVVWITRKAADRGLVRLAAQGLPARGPHAQGHLFLRLTESQGEAQSAARRLLRRFTAAWAA